MAIAQAKTTRKTFTLSEKTLSYLQELASLGTHGDNVTDVGKTLIEQGIRTAIEEGYIVLTKPAPSQ